MDRILSKITLPTGEEITFRLPKKQDVVQMMEYINTLSSEQTFILRQGDQLSLKEETEYVASLLKNIANHTSVYVLAICNEKIIGSSGIDMREHAQKHEGLFGISIAKEYRGIGIGRLLMQTVLDEAQAQLSQLRIITLGVFGQNTIGRNMYEKFGFKEYGWLPEGIVRKGVYDDHIFMYKKVR